MIDEPDDIYAINATMTSQQLEKCQNPDLNNECLSSEMIIKQSRRSQSQQNFIRNVNIDIELIVPIK